jgi:hypothetical protein
MTKYKENDILINEDGDKRKVLGVCGQICFVSKENEPECSSGVFFTEKELEDMEYKLLEEEFNPENGDTYYYPYINGDCSAVSLWKNDEYDIKRKATVGVYRTKEEGDVKLKKILNAIKNLD